MGRLENTWRRLGKHKYIIVCVLFFTNLLFLDRNSLIRRYEHKKEIAALKAEKERYVRISERNARQLRALRTDPRALEKIARERYFMKKADEDIFVFGDGEDGFVKNETAE